MTSNKLRLGCVSYLNARPLIWSLDQDPSIDLRLEVPANLLQGLQRADLDLALLPVIDYQRMPGLKILPVAGIGSDGETLTVRIFSKTPIPQITRLACDTDSHTSVALARILLAERHGLHPEFVPLNSAAAGGELSLLLIGDKVVCDEPKDYPHQLDLGAAWKDLTSLPFVFAVWIAREGVNLADLPAKLINARVEGLRHVDQIVQSHGLPRGWPPATARQYLTQHLRFEVGPRELQAIRLFYELAHKHSIIAGPVRSIDLY